MKRVTQTAEMALISKLFQPHLAHFTNRPRELDSDYPGLVDLGLVICSSSEFNNGS